MAMKHFKSVAVYRCFYGEDFIKESIRSIREHVDAVIVFWADRPWKAVRKVRYLGTDIEIPWRKGHPFDQSVAFTRDLGVRGEKGTRVVAEYYWQDDPMRQFSNMVNASLMGDSLEYVICMEPDMVWKKDQLEAAFGEFKASDWRVATSKQVEVWKRPDFRIKERGRVSATFWNLKDLDRMPNTRRNPGPQGLKCHTLKAHVHNMGFAVGEKTMYWKHLTAIGFSRAIRDTPPNELWLNKWKAWSPDNQLTNLEISQGYAHNIPKALPYDASALPEELESWASAFG